MFNNISLDYVILFLVFVLGFYLYKKKENFECSQSISSTDVNSVVFKNPNKWKTDNNCCDPHNIKATVSTSKFINNKPKLIKKNYCLKKESSYDQCFSNNIRTHDALEDCLFNMDKLPLGVSVEAYKSSYHNYK